MCWGKLQPGANADRLRGTEATVFLFKESAADRCNYDQRKAVMEHIQQIVSALMEADTETQLVEVDHSHLDQTLQFNQTHPGPLKEIRMSPCLQAGSKQLCCSPSEGTHSSCDRISQSELICIRHVFSSRLQPSPGSFRRCRVGRHGYGVWTPHKRLTCTSLNHRLAPGKA